MSAPEAADVVVVGSGVAGALVTWRLARAGTSVIVLEAGPRINREQALETFRDAFPQGPRVALPVGRPRAATERARHRHLRQRVLRPGRARTVRQHLPAHRRWHDLALAGQLPGARAVVLAANAVETPKLLLMSADGAGVANSSDQVGRNLMDHRSSCRGRCPPSRSSRSGTPWPRAGSSRPASPGPAASDRRSASRSATTASASRSGTRPRSSPAHPDGRRSCDCAKVDEPWPDAGRTTSPGRSASPPSPSSCRTRRAESPAFDRPDPIGLPRPRIAFRVGDHSRAGMVAAREVHEQLIDALGASQSNHSDVAFGAGHLMGTTRMGRDPAASVVDADGRNHDCANLYIVGSSVFPTVGTANPTLTLAALSLRTAEILRSRLGKLPPV